MTLPSVSGLSDLSGKHKPVFKIQAIFTRPQQTWFLAHSTTSHEYWLETKANRWQIRQRIKIIGKRILCTFCMQQIQNCEKKRKRSHVTSWLDAIKFFFPFCAICWTLDSLAYGFSRVSVFFESSFIRLFITRLRVYLFIYLFWRKNSKSYFFSLSFPLVPKQKENYKQSVP